jgi:hypothetical protein
MIQSNLNSNQVSQTELPQTPAPTHVPTEKRQAFVNDLTPEEREQAVTEYAERIREQLSGEYISVNCMSRLLNMAHPKVSSLLAVSSSAKEALLDTSVNKVVRAKSLLSKLSDEQRKLLIEQMQKEANS